jgi:hypothetical protein
MNIYEDGFASWEIIPQVDKFSNYEEFINLPKESYVQSVKNMLTKLEEVLRLLEEYNLFKAKVITVGDSEIMISDIKNIVDDFMMLINSDDPKKITSIWCSGETGIYESGILKTFDDIIRVGYEFFIDLISIDLFSDIWMPVDFDLQTKAIEDAKINSLRLESLLRTIKSNGFKINPDDGNVSNEFIAKQIGFRMYYPKYILDKMDKKYLVSLKEFVISDQPG